MGDTPMTPTSHKAAAERLAEMSACIDQLRDELKHQDSVLAMTVARLGGTVEGRLTHRGNFLQRIDALRKIEAAARAYVDRPGDTTRKTSQALWTELCAALAEGEQP